jgi:hypothetical protein
MSFSGDKVNLRIKEVQDEIKTGKIEEKYSVTFSVREDRVRAVLYWLSSHNLDYTFTYLNSNLVIDFATQQDLVSYRDLIE